MKTRQRARVKETEGGRRGGGGWATPGDVDAASAAAEREVVGVRLHDQDPHAVCVGVGDVAGRDGGPPWQS